MRYKITHTTEYRYQYPTTLCYNEAWMSPRSLDCQQVVRSRIKLTPAAAVLRHRQDFFGNEVAFFNVQEPHKRFTITVESEVERSAPANAVTTDHPAASWESVRDQLAVFRPDRIEARSFTLPSPLIRPAEELAAYAAPSFPAGRSLFESVLDLSTRIYREFEYDPEFTTVTTPVLEALSARKGVCQDYAQVAIGCLRSLGLPARYVSGYIETLPPEGEQTLVGAAASHAWFSAFIPDMGWVDFDPTNNQMAREQHITVAWGRDYSDVPPLKGIIFNGNEHELKVAVDVRRMEVD
ncbi:MAG: transglutaminase family protein [Lewinella sp.]|nr:transglutaminase family protein [Lewinella sp.]